MIFSEQASQHFLLFIFLKCNQPIVFLSLALPTEIIGNRNCIWLNSLFVSELLISFDITYLHPLFFPQCLFCRGSYPLSNSQII